MRRAALMAVVFVGFVCFVGGLLPPRANAQGPEDVANIVVPSFEPGLELDYNVLFAEGWYDSYFDYLNSADNVDYPLDEGIDYLFFGSAPALDDAAHRGNVIVIAGAKKTASKAAPAKKTPSPASPAAPTKKAPTTKKKRAR